MDTPLDLTPRYTYTYGAAPMVQVPYSPQIPSINYQQPGFQPNQPQTPGLSSGLINTGVKSVFSPQSGNQMGLLSSATNSINSFGSNYLGLGNPLPMTPTGLMQGPVAPGTLGTTTGLTNILGAAGAGYFGGGKIAELTGGNKTGGSIGGSLGGALGSYAAGTSAGLAAGAALGIGSQALNFVVPGLGILAGGVLGGMFGNKKPGTVSSEFGGMLNSSGDLVDRSFGSKRAEDTQGRDIAQKTADFYKALKAETGVDLSNNLFRGGINTVYQGGGYLAVDKRGANLSPDPESGGDPKYFNFNYDKPSELSRALGESASYLAEARGLDQASRDKIKQFSDNYTKKSEAGILDGKKNGFYGMATIYSNRTAEGVPLVPDIGKTNSSFKDFVNRYNTERNSK